MAKLSDKENTKVPIGNTAGVATGRVQGNLVVLPAEYAADFLLFCARNTSACPLIGVTDVGNPLVPSLGRDIDLRFSVPKYRVWENGKLVSEPSDVADLWRNDLVGFVIGCSFTFEHALLADGIPLRHIEQGTNVAMFRTKIQTEPAGIFRGPVVVSMRPFQPRHLIRAIQITSRFPMMHGAPLHVGKPELIGINDLAQPDYGDAVDILDDELPMFWACGVTPQAAIAEAKIPFAITHAPGCMLVTERENREYAIL